MQEINKNIIIKTLTDFIKIESVSTDTKRFSEMLTAVSFLKNILEKIGFNIKIISKDKKPPLIIATKIISSQEKTIAIYGHYDIQPEDPLDKWKTDPFKLTITNGKIYGRGTADNKGHIMQNIFAIKELIDTGKLKNNIIFIFEGEEETGSSCFEKYIKEASDLLKKADVFYITDAGMREKNKPQIYYGLRGLIYFEIKIKIGEKDLHSGIYGNRVYNPANILSNLFAKMQDMKTKRILIPCFYDRVRQLSQKELQFLSKVSFSDTSLEKEAKVYNVMSVDGYPAYLVSKILPSFDINGIYSGYCGEGSKTVIPCEARAKFSFRLVEYQDANEIEKYVKEFIKENMPDGVKYELKVHSKSDPFYTSTKNEYMIKTAAILTDFFKNITLYNRSGGTVAAAEILQRIYKKPVILTGFTLADDNLHAPNENFDEEMFWKGIEALKKIYG